MPGDRPCRIDLSARVIEVLLRLISKRGATRFLRSDNGSEFVNQAILNWLVKERVEIAHIDPGKPWKRAS